MNAKIKGTLEKLSYKETYKKGSARMLPDKLPILRHLTEGFEVVEAHLKESGVVTRGDEVLEYCDIRVYVKEVV